MNGLAFIGGVEVLLLFVIVAKIRQNAELLKRIRACNDAFAHAMALASQARYAEAKEAARHWADRMKAHMAGEPYRRPEPPPQPRQHERTSRDRPRQDRWHGRFAP
jgi:hypothetical protein